MHVPYISFIQAIRFFAANNVYFLEYKHDVLKGFRHHDEQRVESYSWNKDPSVLEANVRVDGLNAVSFWVEHGRLSFSCDCHAWKPESHCAHVIGALLTTINLLAPHLFPRRRQNPRYLDALKRMLAGDTETPPQTPLAEMANQFFRGGPLASAPTSGMRPLPAPAPKPKDKPSGTFAIVLENSDGASHIQVQRDGRPVFFGSSAHLPKELAPSAIGTRSQARNQRCVRGLRGSPCR
jgi:hypothetical protein